jgi:esterase/lipase superfamily enzyme
LVELDEARVTGAIPAEPQFVITKVFFATDRNVSEKPGETFGVKRGSSLSYGFCKVSIPRDHRMGSLEAPSIWKLERRKDPSKHVVLLRTAIQPKEEFFKDVATRVKASNGKKAFIFVHGYNVTFEDAARRTAQMSYDLGFDGAPVFYSWPSQGLLTPIGYTTDEQNIEWSQANFRRFLEDFFARSDAQDVYLIAHSMGNRSLTRAVASLLTDTPSIKERLKEIILTAPDIDAEVFGKDIVPILTASGRPVTLYASSNDFALAMSKKVHGFPRAGDTGSGLIIAPGIETIDATNTDTSFAGHSYYAERRSILADMFYLVTEGHRADTRFGLKKIITPKGGYWEIKK